MKGMLGQRAFRTLWIAQFVSIFGDFIAVFGVISLITFRLHGTAVDVTSVVIAYILPPALIGPFSGVLVDRWNVKRVMIASDLVRAFLAAALVFVTDVRQIGVVLAALSVVSSFFAPAQSVALRTLVAPQDLLAANALLAQAFYLVRILSPALAGALVSWLSEKACFWLDAGSFFFSAAMLATLVISRPPVPRREASVKALAGDLAEGNRFIFTHRGLSFAFLAMGAAMFVLSSFSPLISIYIRDTLHAGTMIYGVISSMIGVGLIAGTQLVNRAGKDRPADAVIVFGLFMLGMGAALLGAIRNTVAAAASTFTIGLAIAFVYVPGQTLQQRETPPPMVGRVSSTFMSLFSLSQVLGLALSGVLAVHLGIRQLFLAAAGALVLLTLIGRTALRPRVQTDAAL
jgi:MFS transporter, DHA3 family, macrolide efflux protein